jgi:hypothetical protein
MAPFMILGRKLRLVADLGKCANIRTFVRFCF